MPTQQKGTGAFRDAATYNQHLVQQQQAYSAQQQAAQAAQNVYRNPYLQPNTQQPSQQTTPTSSYNNPQEANNVAFPPQHRLTHQTSHGHLSSGSSQYGSSSGYGVSSQHLSPTAPSNTYQSGGTTRARSNTINPMMDHVPPALARLQHMNQDVIGGRKALTPVLKRDDPLREWERRQSGKGAAPPPYPQLELLQQQAEMAAAQGLVNWGYSGQPQASARYAHQQPTSNLATSYTNMMVDDDRREAVMSNVRSAARGDGNAVMYGSSTSIIPSPPQAYASTATTSGNRYTNAYSQSAAMSPLDSMDRRNDIGQLYVPMQPDQYGGYNTSGGPQQGGRPIAPPTQTVPPSFYPSNAVPSGQQASGVQRNPFGQAEGLPTTMGTKEGRRKSGMDLWQQ